MLGKGFALPARPCDGGDGANAAERPAGTRVKDMAQFLPADLELPFGSTGGGERPSRLEQEMHRTLRCVARVDNADRPFSKRKPGFFAAILRRRRRNDFRRAQRTPSQIYKRRGDPLLLQCARDSFGSMTFCQTSKIKLHPL